MANAVITTFGKHISAGSTAISASSTTALDIEDTAGQDFITIETTGPENDANLILMADGGQVVLRNGGDEGCPTLAFGDQNTGFYESSDNHLHITTSSTARMTIDSDGKVGIGAAPECIAGGLHIQTEDTSTGDGGSTIPSNAALLIEGTNPKAVFACGSGANDVSQLQFLHSDGDGTGTEVGRIMAGKMAGVLAMRFDFGSSTGPHMEYTGKGWNIGAQAAPDGSALFQITSTSKGFLLPRMTTTQRDAIGSPADGLVIYDTVTDKINVRADGAWEVVTSS